MWQLGICSFCYPNGVSLYPLLMRQQGIGKRGLGRLIRGVFFAGLSFVSQSMPFPQHDPLTHKCLFHSLALGRVREYFRAAHVLAPFFLAPTSSITTLVLIAPHPKSDGYFPLFFKKMSQSVATLALGSRPRQRGCKGACQEEAQESHQRLPGV